MVPKQANVALHRQQVLDVYLTDIKVAVEIHRVVALKLQSQPPVDSRDRCHQRLVLVAQTLLPGRLVDPRHLAVHPNPKAVQVPHRVVFLTDKGVVQIPHRVAAVEGNEEIAVGNRYIARHSLFSPLNSRSARITSIIGRIRAS